MPQSRSPWRTITRSDIANPSTVANLTAELARINPAADILDILDVDTFRPLLGTRGFPERCAAAVAQNMGKDLGVLAHLTHHTLDVAALALNLDEPIEWAPFSIWLSLLLHSHGENILSFKALLEVTGSSGRVMLDGVHPAS
jgi:G3E family GTPase